MKRAKLQYAFKSVSYKLHRISKNIINYKLKIIYAHNNKTLNMNVHVSTSL